MQGSAHHLAQQIEAIKSLAVNPEQAVAAGHQIQFTFDRFTDYLHARPGQGGGHQYGCLVFMDIIGSKFKNIDIFLAQPFKMFDIFGSDDMTFTEGSAFELPLANFRNIVGQDHAHRIGNWNSFMHARFSR